MLTLTENASTIVRDLTTREGAPETAGLRISAGAEEGTMLEITHAAAALPGDQVIEQDGATVYLDETAGRELDDKVLDAGIDVDGKVQFAVGLQA